MTPALAFITCAMATDLLLQGGQLWDGTGADYRRADVLLHDDRVAAVGLDLPVPPGARVLDARGTTVIPGLIDSHVHLSMSPGAAWRAPEPSLAGLTRHLAAYVACGVTTVVDPGVTLEHARAIADTIASGVPAPRYVALGPPLSPPGGYVSVLLDEFAPVATEADVALALDRAVSAGLPGVKVTVEDGFVAPVWPLHRPEILHAIRRGAAERGLRVYAHAMSPAEQRVALDDLGASVLVHPLDRPHAATVRRVAASRAYEMTTLSVYDAPELGWTPGRLDDPRLDALVPPQELATARDPASQRAYELALLATVYPRLPAKGSIAASPLPRALTRARLRRTGRALLAMATAGVPLVMGSDSGNWPIIPYLFHGPTSIRELELMHQAGLSPEAVLAAATRTPAEMLGLSADIGTVEPGKAADLVVVRGNPLENLATLHDPVWVVRGGEAHTPDEWLAAATARR